MAFCDMCTVPRPFDHSGDLMPRFELKVENQRPHLREIFNVHWAHVSSKPDCSTSFLVHL